MSVLIYRNEQQEGPYDLNTLRQGLATGRFLPEDFAFQDGCADWVPLRTLIPLEPHPPASATERVECIQCNRLILPALAERTGGICMLCFKPSRSAKQLNSAGELAKSKWTEQSFWIVVGAVVLAVLMVWVIASQGISSSNTHDASYLATEAGLNDGYYAGLADAQANKRKMGSSTSLEAGNSLARSKPFDADPSYYGRAWAKGYDKGYDRYSK